MISTENLLDYSYHHYYFKLTITNLSRQTNTTIAQEINFIEKSEKNDGVTLFLFLESNRNNFKHSPRFSENNKIL